MKNLATVLLLIGLVGCGKSTSTIPPFHKLPPEQVEALPAGEKVCYEIAASMNGAWPSSPTRCTPIRENTDGQYKDSFSFYLETSTDEGAEWKKWGCLAVGKTQTEVVDINMVKAYFKSDPSNKYAEEINVPICAFLQRQAYSQKISEFEVLKGFNRYSRLKEM